MKINTKLIAPCGMNCSLCVSFQRDKNKCPGCRLASKHDRISAYNCKIRNCAKLKKFCFTCKEFPCKAIKHIDKRYRTKYNMSMIENLLTIKKAGIRKFVASEEKRWLCPTCKGLICVHKKYCLKCKKRS